MKQSQWSKQQAVELWKRNEQAVLKDLLNFLQNEGGKMSYDRISS
jgi:hypothetical protein